MKRNIVIATLVMLTLIKTSDTSADPATDIDTSKTYYLVLVNPPLKYANARKRGATFEVWAGWDYALISNVAGTEQRPSGTPVKLTRHASGKYTIQMQESNYGNKWRSFRSGSTSAVSNSLNVYLNDVGGAYTFTRSYNKRDEYFITLEVQPSKGFGEPRETTYYLTAGGGDFPSGKEWIRFRADHKGLWKLVPAR